MSTTTHREFLTWCAWFDKEWNQPSRSDWYLMQIAKEVFCVLRKDRKSITADKFKIEFKQVKPKSDSSLSKEVKTNWAKSAWMALVGYKGKK